jgi:hypothetical protein
VAVLLLVHVGLLNPLPGVRPSRGLLVKQPPHEVLPIVGAIAQALHTAPMIPKPHWLGMKKLLSLTPRHRRGGWFSRKLAGHAGKERGPGLITPRPSPLLASVVVGARSLLALLLFSASS